MHYTTERKVKEFDYVIKQIEAGRPLRQILLDDGTPSMQTWSKWLDKDPKLVERYVRATDLRADKIFEEILEIADDSSRDLTFSEKGNAVMDQEFAARSRIRIDARKWVLAKMKPTKYGDKLDVTSGDKPIASATIVGMVIKDEFTPDEKPFEDELL